jgi:hypothetical protein
MTDWPYDPMDAGRALRTGRTFSVMPADPPEWWITKRWLYPAQMTEERAREYLDQYRGGGEEYALARLTEVRTPDGDFYWVFRAEAAS